MVKKDAKQISELLTGYLSKFTLHPEFKQDEVVYWFTPRENIIYTYVVEDEDKKITDMISFYELPSSVLKSDKYDRMRAAYSYYNVPGKHSLKDLMSDALVLANNAGFDVFNCLDLMDNADFLKELKFGVGDGHLRYYLYNWKVPKNLTPKDIGMILV